MADTPVPMVAPAAGAVPAAFAALVTTTSPYGIDDLWVRNDTDGAIELSFNAGSVTNALLLAGESGFWPRIITGAVLNYRYLSGSQPTTGFVRAGGFI